MSQDRFIIITGLVEKTLPTGKIQYIYIIQDTITGKREGEATSSASTGSPVRSSKYTWIVSLAMSPILHRSRILATPMKHQ